MVVVVVVVMMVIMLKVMMVVVMKMMVVASSKNCCEVKVGNTCHKEKPLRAYYVNVSYYLTVILSAVPASKSTQFPTSTSVLWLTRTQGDKSRAIDTAHFKCFPGNIRVPLAHELTSLAVIWSPVCDQARAQNNPIIWHRISKCVFLSVYYIQQSDLPLKILLSIKE